jgi:uncharacterized protein (DUF1778 family)
MLALGCRFSKFIILLISINNFNEMEKLTALRLPAAHIAARTVREHEVLTLSGLDRQVFIDALVKPISTNMRLRQAAKR